MSQADLKVQECIASLGALEVTETDAEKWDRTCPCGGQLDHVVSSAVFGLASVQLKMCGWCERKYVTHNRSVKRFNVTRYQMPTFAGGFDYAARFAEIREQETP